jgi:hypothetical protein
MDELDTRIRLRAFSFLEDLCSRYGLALPREVLLSDFDFEGKRVPLISPQGIFKPEVLPEIPLSITTVPVVEGKSRDGSPIDASSIRRICWRIFHGSLKLYEPAMTSVPH